MDPAGAIPRDTMDDEGMGDSIDPTPPFSAAGGGGGNQLLPPLSLGGVSHPAHSSSSSALSAGDEEVPHTPHLSPTLQASVAAWQSAACLLHDLQVQQQHQGQPDPFLDHAPVHHHQHLLNKQQQQKQQKQQQAAWLRATLKGGGDPNEACSPERHPAASDAAATTALHPLSPC